MFVGFRCARAVTAGAFLLAATGMAMAIGPGETALTARNSSMDHRGEVRLMTEQTSRTTNWFSCPGDSRRYYVGSYEVGEVQAWQGRGLTVWVEYMSSSGRRQGLCKLDRW